MTASHDIERARFAQLNEIANQEIAAGHIAGAVVLVGHKGKIVYREAFGQKSTRPHPEAMTTDTLFDLASVTKVVATSTAIMQLVERGQLKLDDAAARYWPAFGQNGKEAITLRQLMTHTSGLRAEVNGKGRWSDYQGAMQAILADKPLSTAGTTFRYSDVNFIVLGEIVRRVSGLPLEDYCAKNIFTPLGLKDTTFKPEPRLRPRVAPSDLRWGEVQDPTAYRMGGVAGNAGLFSTADDLAVFAQMLLNGGLQNGRRILSADSVTALSNPHGISGQSTLRGLGWDIRSPYSKDHTSSFPLGSFGHTGYTGTSLWIEPKSQTFLIILTSRLHPDGKGNARPLRAKAAAMVASALPMGPAADSITQTGADAAPIMPGSGQADNVDSVRTGMETLKTAGFAPLQGKNVGVITNHTGIGADGRSTIDLLRQAPGLKLRAIFSPEHGLGGKLDEKIASGQDPVTGLPIYSLYGNDKKPTTTMLAGLDALVYDIQDIGARFYTYITTMAYAMEAAAAAGLDFYVLDRPNPINATIVQGPVMDESLKSFTGYFPLPVRYGMTVGELAQLFNHEYRIGAKLQVMPMQGYRRDSWLDETGLAWIDPSPNIRSLTEAILYPGVALVEAANLSVGRGTDTPFEIVGAPWISGYRLADYLNQRQIPGVSFTPTTFQPQSDRYRRQRCEGVRLQLTDRDTFDAPRLGLELTIALQHLYPDSFELDRTRSMFGSRAVLESIKQGKSPEEIQRGWQSRLDEFLKIRAKYLIY
ncbi:exo-beta-N-acetylmuramidase NamZ domain-containing protein [Methylomonas rapida]|uniref:DUF1343 domain-containing protein n=1 Tax=Methylomonas rapida TaxID=2963939 RepID=A0ABY7GEK5_9GAMM|nr:exo-beta-N-acetylmuramidase NamZ domain-containing protein [Methylomonas rapida]WAR43717.1 DUF1343 domain-containing protein [Methylomonas rapida]